MRTYCMPMRAIGVVGVSLVLCLVGAGTGVALTAAAGQDTAPVAPVRVGGQIPIPRKIRDVLPAYPDLAVKAHVQGTVVLQIIVGATGQVENASVLRGAPLLNQAAIDAVRQWLFTPTLVNGVATPVVLIVEVSFNLSAGARPVEADTRLLPAPSPTAALTDEEARREPLLLGAGRAGVVEIGMSVDGMLRRVVAARRKLVDLQQEGHFTPAIGVTVEPADKQFAMMVFFRQVAGQWTVSGIEIGDPRFRTTDGLGVGSTLADVRAAAPSAQPQFRETGGVPAAVVSLPDRGLSFWFEAVLSGDRTLPDTAPQTAVVTRVSVSAPTP